MRQSEREREDRRFMEIYRNNSHDLFSRLGLQDQDLISDSIQIWYFLFYLFFTFLDFFRLGKTNLKSMFTERVRTRDVFKFF